MLPSSTMVGQPFRCRRPARIALRSRLRSGEGGLYCPPMAQRGDFAALFSATCAPARKSSRVENGDFVISVALSMSGSALLGAGENFLEEVTHRCPGAGFGERVELCAFLGSVHAGDGEGVHGAAIGVQLPIRRSCISQLVFKR
jgi:hypothetical protein